VSKAFADCVRYNRWANLRLIDACRALTDEQLDTRATQSSRSVRELLQHVVGSSRHVEEKWPGIEMLRDVVAATGDELIAIATDLDEDEMVALPYQGKTPEYPKFFFLLHAIEHGVEHRTEIKVTLALIGIETPDLDGWFYSPAAGYGREI
jgi:uncharacterized damage-inducible protein DinB